jgi:hypothetical protein
VNEKMPNKGTNLLIEKCQIKESICERKNAK